MERLIREVTRAGRFYSSSAKVGNDVSCLFDGNEQTFWQSDGVLPHWIHVEFSQRTPLARLEIGLNRGRDESYTPLSLVVLAGDSDSQIVEVTDLTLDSLENDFVNVDLAALNDDVRYCLITD